MNAQNFFQKRKGADLSKIVYPTVILITGWYAVVNIYQVFTRQGDIVYTVVWALVPIAFVYLLLTGTKLKFRWSILSLIGMIMAGLFAFFVLLEIFSPHFDRKAFFFSGLWDHYLWPIAFGLFFLCDLRNLPKLFWLLLSPFAFFCLILGNLAFITHALFGKSIIPDFPGILVFWGVQSWNELSQLPREEFIRGLTFFFQELPTFFTTIPLVIFYYLLKSFKSTQQL